MAASAGLALSLLRVLVLGIFAPQTVDLSTSGQTVRVSATGDRLVTEGAAAGGALEVTELRVPAVGTAPAGVLVRFQHHGQEVSRRFAGALVLRAAAGHVQLVNEVDEEHYVEKVLLAEGGEAAAYPQAAQALAVVVRSFAGRAADHPRHGDVSLCDLTHCQVYRGEGPGPWAKAAAEATAGQVLGYRGVPADAYFTATCGGATAAASEVWGGQNRPYLQSRPCEPCQRDPRTRWAAEISLQALDPLMKEQRLLPARCPLGALAVDGRGAGGWVSHVHASCRNGGPGAGMSGESLRLAVGRKLGWSRLPSANFTLRLAEPVVHFDGRGSGHGVGLCLYGAVAHARSGWTRRQILDAYFPGTSLISEKDRGAGP